MLHRFPLVRRTYNTLTAVWTPSRVTMPCLSDYLDSKRHDDGSTEPSIWTDVKDATTVEGPKRLQTSLHSERRYQSFSY